MKPAAPTDGVTLDARTFKRLWAKREVLVHKIAPLPKDIEEAIVSTMPMTYESTEATSRFLTDYSALLGAQAGRTKEEFLAYASDAYDLYGHMAQAVKDEPTRELKRDLLRHSIVALFKKVKD